MATCLLCQPPAAIGEDILHHLRLVHPGAMDAGPSRHPDAVPEPGVIARSDVEQGVSCTHCHRPFRLGETYAERLHGFTAGLPVVEMTCLGCDMAAVPWRLRVAIWLQRRCRRG